MNICSITTKEQIKGDSDNRQVQGRALIIARVVWLVLSILIVALYIVLLPTYFTRLQTICTPGLACAVNQPTAASVQMMQRFGISLNAFAVFTFVLTLISSLLCFAVGVIIFWRRSHERVGLIVSLSLMFFGTGYVSYTLQQSYTTWHVTAQTLDILTYGAVFLMLLVFPDGRFVPRWTPWLVFGWILWSACYTFLPALRDAFPVHTIIWTSIVIACIGTQIYRFRYVSGPIQRQQTKWVVSGITIALIMVMAFNIPAFILNSMGQPGSIYALLDGPASLIGITSLPLTLGIAITRSHLWDIDIIINRAIIYTSLTVALIALYAGCVLLLQYIFRAMTGQGSVLALILSTLVIALLVQPLLRRIQEIINRRFYRRKYDAARTLSHFEDMLRSRTQVDLASLTDDVLAVINETMQPEHLSILLCKIELPQVEPGITATTGRNSTTLSVALDSESAQKTAPANPGTTDVILPRYRRILARILWVAVAVLTLAAFFATISFHSTYLHIVCADIVCGGSASRSLVASQLSQIGLSLNFYSYFSLARQIIFATGYFGVAAILFWRKPDNRMTFLVGLFLMTFVIAFIDAPGVLTQNAPAWKWPVACIAFIGEMSLPLCFYLFPDGRFFPKWTPWLLIGWLLWGINSYFIPDAPFKSSAWFLLLQDLAFICGLGSLAFVQFHRYQYISNPVQRQQTKWVLFGLAGGLVGFFGAGILGFVLPRAIGALFNQPESLFLILSGMIANTINYLAMLLIPLSFVVAMLRYRLWEINVLINRALIYSVLLFILGFIFLISFIAQQELIQTFIGQASDGIIVGAVLAIVLLFRPLRRSIQSFIDHYFYRRKYRMEQALNNFNASLRHEVNLDHLCEELIDVVSETMEPAHISLWLRNSEPNVKGPHYTGILRM